VVRIHTRHTRYTIHTIHALKYIHTTPTYYDYIHKHAYTIYIHTHTLHTYVQLYIYIHTYSLWFWYVYEYNKQDTRSRGDYNHRCNGTSNIMYHVHTQPYTIYVNHTGCCSRPLHSVMVFVYAEIIMNNVFHYKYSVYM
jgi:hypothetical protein